MTATEWLYDLAVRHEKVLAPSRDLPATGARESQLSLPSPLMSGLGGGLDELGIHESVIAEIPCPVVEFVGLAAPELLLLAHFFKKNVNDGESATGIELIRLLKITEGHTLVYLAALNRLADLGWLYLKVGRSVMLITQPPYCWLHATCEFGAAFHDLVGAEAGPGAPFENNDQYLTEMFNYIQQVGARRRHALKLASSDEDPSKTVPDQTLRHIEERAHQSRAELPAFALRKRFALSLHQHLCLLGMYGRREGELDVDFSDPAEVLRTFTASLDARETLREHIYGKRSPILQRRLIEGREGPFGQRFSLSVKAVMALVAHKVTAKDKKEIITEIGDRTIFEVELPRIREDAVFLPEQVRQTVEAIVYGESPAGRRERREWLKALPGAWGAPTGTTVLLYGPSGTGKTLTAQCVASRLKRPLLKVDAAKVLGMWVGQSEQSVSQIFDEYRTVLDELRMAPVLLFNEADQLLGTRGKADGAVDKMYNNMQNLFLEGLERFTGILIATTNRRDLLDSAFSRRFTYKLELPPPDTALRRKIWITHLPMKRLATGFDIQELAEVELTGGEIRIVVEKAVRLAAWRGDRTLSREVLLELAQEELAGQLDRDQVRKAIGV